MSLRRVIAGSPEEALFLQQLKDREEATDEAVAASVREILADVRSRGEEAVLSYGLRFDGAVPETLQVPQQEIEDAWKAADPDFRSALELAASNIWTRARISSLSEVCPACCDFSISTTAAESWVWRLSSAASCFFAPSSLARALATSLLIMRSAASSSAFAAMIAPSALARFGAFTASYANGIFTRAPICVL